MSHFPLPPPRVAFLPWGDFHARWRVARSTIPEDKWGTTRSLSVRTCVMMQSECKERQEDAKDKLQSDIQCTFC